MHPLEAIAGPSRSTSNRAEPTAPSVGALFSCRAGCYLRRGFALRAAFVLGTNKRNVFRTAIVSGSVRPLDRWARTKVRAIRALLQELSIKGFRVSPDRKRHDRALAAIRLSGLFDLAFYASQGSAFASVDDAIAHYLARGSKEGRKPNPLFDGRWYLDRYQDVREAEIDPLFHYIVVGATEGRDPHPLFETRWYVKQAGQAVASAGTALAHFLAEGAEALLDPNPLFHSGWYAARYPGVRDAANPLVHWIDEGASRGYAPSLLFDVNYYLSSNPDVARSDQNPLAHYIWHGDFERRDPHPLFSCAWYMDRVPDFADDHRTSLAHFIHVGYANGFDPHPLLSSAWYLEVNGASVPSGMDPLTHYLTSGAERGLDPVPLFDTDWYAAQHPEVAAAGTNPLVHFVTEGAKEGFDPSPVFSTRFYRDADPTVDETEANPLAHFIHTPIGQLRDPSPLFDCAGYLRRYPEVAALRSNPLTHYVQSGFRDRDPNPFFETGWYLEQYRDLSDPRINPLVHFITTGSREGRDPGSRFSTASYARRYGPLIGPGQTPLEHYLAAGRRLGLRPVDPNVSYRSFVRRQQLQDGLAAADTARHLAVMLRRPSFLILVGPGDDSSRRRTLGSLKLQVYGNFRVADEGLASVARSEGDDADVFLCWIDCGDTLDPMALYAYASELNRDDGIDVLYSDSDDEDDAGERANPVLKPDWSPDFHERLDYLGSATCFRLATAARHLPHASSRFDLALRVSEGNAHVSHIRRVLVHRRPGRNDQPGAASDLAALRGRLARTGRVGEVEVAASGERCYRLNLQLRSRRLVSIVIPATGRVVDIDGRPTDLLVNCVEAVAGRSTYRQIEFVIVYDGNLAESQLDAAAKLGCRLVSAAGGTPSLSGKLNRGAEASAGELLLLLQDDVAPVAPDWLERMMQPFEAVHAGAVGAKLLSRDSTVRHAGMVLNNGEPVHVGVGAPRDDFGYLFGNRVDRNVCAVAGECMLTPSSLYREVGGYSEDLATDYNDVDYCFKVRAAGRTIVYVPDAELVQLSSRSPTSAKSRHDQSRFQERWAYELTSDPFHNEDYLAPDPVTSEFLFSGP